MLLGTIPGVALVPGIRVTLIQKDAPTDGPFESVGTQGLEVHTRGASLDDQIGHALTDDGTELETVSVEAAGNEEPLHLGDLP